jgi:hypothetical protein
VTSQLEWSAHANVFQPAQYSVLSWEQLFDPSVVIITEFQLLSAASRGRHEQHSESRGGFIVRPDGPARCFAGTCDPDSGHGIA